MARQATAGFTLVELVIVAAIIAVLAVAAVPTLTSSKVAANEAAAISTLRNLQSAQAEFWSVAAMDDDADGAGEFGWFGELSGLTNMNARANGNGKPQPYVPTILGNKFQQIDAAGTVTLSGYVFQIYLPDAAGTGIAEAGGGGPTGLEDADQCEMVWAAYAYPAVVGSSGNRCFFINHRGEVVQTSMDLVTYDRASGAPPWNAALNFVDGRMSDPLGIGGLAANDGNAWVVVQ